MIIRGALLTLTVILGVTSPVRAQKISAPPFRPAVDPQVTALMPKIVAAHRALQSWQFQTISRFQSLEAESLKMVPVELKMDCMLGRPARYKFQIVQGEGNHDGQSHFMFISEGSKLHLGGWTIFNNKILDAWSSDGADEYGNASHTSSEIASTAGFFAKQNSGAQQIESIIEIFQGKDPILKPHIFKNSQLQQEISYFSPRKIDGAMLIGVKLRRKQLNKEMFAFGFWEEITFWFDAKTYLLHHLRYRTEQPGQSSHDYTVLLVHQKLNPPITEETFRFVLPVASKPKQ